MLTASQLPNPRLNWPIPMEAVALIAEFEGLRLVSYQCIAGVWTCGYGETDGVGPGMRWTKAYADQRFCDSLTERVNAVRAMLTTYTTEHELAAMTSLAYNIGLAGLKRSSVLSAHNRGDKQAAARAFALWNKATVNGVLTVLPGLVSRRSREAALYFTPDDEVQPDPMPQVVAPESSLIKSPIAGSGAAVVVAGVAQAVNEATTPVAAVQSAGEQAGALAQAMQHIKGLFIDVLGIPQGAWLPVVLIVAGVAVMYWRKRQRSEGWA